MWISLIGFNASGKTTLAGEFGQLTAEAVVDLDEAVTMQSGRTVPGIFDEGGPALFRDLEARVLGALPPQQTLILATGGGTLERPDTVALLRERGLLVWLDAPWPALRRRLAPVSGGEGTPVWRHLGAEGLYRLYCRRRPLFAAHAHLRLDARRDPQHLARRLLGRALQLTTNASWAAP